MADLNRQLIDINQKTSKLRDDITSLLRDYENMYHEANGIYMTERMSSNNEGLEDFFMLLQTIRRNRDIIGSVFKGLSNIRSTDKFRFIEEDIQQEKEKKEKESKKIEKRKQRKSRGYLEIPSPGTEAAPVDFKEITEPEPEVVTNG